jgi:hypothetical protein
LYKIPENFPLKVFVGCLLESVSFSVNTVHFTFDSDEPLSITVEGSTSHEYTDETGSRVNRIEEVPVRETFLVQLAGKSVIAADSEKDGVDLRLEFSDGQVLRCLGESEQYEMYRITAGEREVII